MSTARTYDEVFVEVQVSESGRMSGRMNEMMSGLFGHVLRQAIPPA